MHTDQPLTISSATLHLISATAAAAAGAGSTPLQANFHPPIALLFCLHLAGRPVAPMNPYSGGSTLATVGSVLLLLAVWLDIHAFPGYKRSRTTLAGSVQVLRVSAAGFGLIYGTSKMASLRVSRHCVPICVDCLCNRAPLYTDLQSQPCTHAEAAFCWMSGHLLFRICLHIETRRCQYAGKGSISIQGKCGCCSICSALRGSHALLQPVHQVAAHDHACYCSGSCRQILVATCPAVEPRTAEQMTQGAFQ